VSPAAGPAVGWSDRVDLEFSAPLFRWVGPAPWYFVAVPAERCDGLRAASAFVTYGWGMIPVRARIGTTHWKTSLWPKDGVYLLPVKASVREAEGIEEGDSVSVGLDVGR